MSVDLRQGKARLRLVALDGIEIPGVVTVAGKGDTTATFYTPAGGSTEEPVLQWKKVGRQRVKAASVVISNYGEPD